MKDSLLRCKSLHAPYELQGEEGQKGEPGPVSASLKFCNNTLNAIILFIHSEELMWGKLLSHRSYYQADNI